MASEETKGFVDIGGSGGGSGGSGGARLEYRSIPATRAGLPTLVFLHEGLGCVAIWKDVPDRLATMTGCGALVYSRSGYGHSSPAALPRPLTYLQDEAETVLPAVLDAFGLTDVILVGHSDGASIALLAAAGPLAPRIRLAICEAPHVLVEDVTVAGIRAVVALYDTGPLRERLKRLHGANVDVAFRGWSDAWLTPAFRHWTIEDRLSDIRPPLLVIQGVNDEYATARQHDSIAARSGGPVSVLVVEDCGHTPHRDQPGTVLPAMAAAIAEAIQSEGDIPLPKG